MSTTSTLFLSRLNRFWNDWMNGYENKKSLWYQMDMIFISSGQLFEDVPTPKAMQFHLWLWNNIFQDSFIVAIRSKIFCLLADKNDLNSVKGISGGQMILLDKQNDPSNESNINVILSYFKTYINNNSKNVYNIGLIQGKHEEIIGDYANNLQKSFFNLLDFVKIECHNIRDAFGLLLSIHDAPILLNMEKASKFAIRLYQDILLLRIEDILDNESSVSHKDIVSLIDNIFEDKVNVDIWKTKYQLNSDFLNIVYCNVQSGSSFDLRPASVPSTSSLSLDPGTIIISLGVTYNDYASNLVRTILFNANKHTRMGYCMACDILDYSISFMIPEASLNDIYNNIKKYVEDKFPDYFQYLRKSFGHALGLEFCESCLMLNGKSDKRLREGMVFNMSISFSNIPAKPDDKPNHPFSLWISDTVQVNQKGKLPKVLTQACDRSPKSVNYELMDDEVDSPPTDLNKKKKDVMKHDQTIKMNEANQKNGPVNTSTLPSKRSSAICVETMKKLLEDQKILRDQKVIEMRNRYPQGHEKLSSYLKKKDEKKLSSIIAYKDPSMYIKEFQYNRLFIDPNNNCVFLPIPGYGPIPIHCSMIKTVTCQLEDNKLYTVRIQFNIPRSIGPNKQENIGFPEVFAPDGMFMKEIILRSTNQSIPEICKNIKEIQKSIKQNNENEGGKQESSGHVQLEVNRNRMKTIVLKGVILKWASNSRRVFGHLEAHLNGLRYSGQRSETVDIIYSNIKYVFFQPCENDVVVLFHFHLKEPVMINKKKVWDIQIYSESVYMVEDLDSRRKFRNIHDPDELEEEVKEREAINRRNAEFKKFSQEVQELAKQNNVQLVFDIPFRDLSFYGVTKNYNQLLFPTSKCLVQLIEWPIFILSLHDIEIVTFERLYHGLRQFDMAFIFKDYSKPVLNITSIPISYLQKIKKWLNQIGIVWYESKRNLNWNEILRIISEDIIGFLDDGGFEIFLQDETSKIGSSKVKSTNTENDQNSSDDDDNSEYSSENEVFDENEDGYDDEEDDDDDDDDDLVDDDEVESDPSDDTEEGLSWEELERQAIIDDNKRSRNAMKSNPMSYGFSSGRKV